MVCARYRQIAPLNDRASCYTVVVIPASCQCRDEFLWRVIVCALRVAMSDSGIWDSFTTVPKLTELILRTDRLLPAVTVECTIVWIR